MRGERTMADQGTYASGRRFAASFRKAAVAVMCLMLAGTALTPGTAQACPADPLFNDPETILINNHTTDRFQEHQDWMVDDFFIRDLLPNLMAMTEQLSAVAMQQMEIVGAFLDAKHQLETQRLFQEMAAQTHKDYNPSEEVCTIGTTIRSLAGSERPGVLTSLQLAKHSMDRQNLNANKNSTEGPKEDLEGRIAQFRRVYCEAKDDNNNLENICGSGVSQLRKNKDVDYTRTLANPETLDLDFSDATLSADEEDILALSSNLYSHDVFAQIPAAQLKNNDKNQEIFFDQRSLIAQRSVAAHSFQEIAAMKTKGVVDAEPVQYLQSVLEGVGIPNVDAQAILGENPSYYQQMGVVTKALFQRPEFYVGLYDRPANVARKGVALQALSLMQKRDIFKSALRSEAIISLILELELRNAQDAAQNEANRLKEGLIQ